MDFLTRVSELMKEKDIKRSNLCELLDLNQNSFQNWEKRGTLPKGETIIKMAKFFDVSTDYLLGVSNKDPEITHNCRNDAINIPQLFQYHSNHPENDTISKKYNIVCKVLRLIHGKKESFALLSAIGIPNDKPVSFSESQIAYIAFKTGVNKAFFDDNNLGKYNPEKLREKMKIAGMEPDFEDLCSLKHTYPEVETWEKNYKHLYFQAMQIGVNMTVFEEIANTLSSFSNDEQVEIKVIFEEAVKQYENKIKQRMAQEFDDIAAERKDEVS
ncbi:MAG: helix-turn-helix domain-containing protein [Huintestinicola sp.]